MCRIQARRVCVRAQHVLMLLHMQFMCGHSAVQVEAEALEEVDVAPRNVVPGKSTLCIRAPTGQHRR